MTIKFQIVQLNVVRDYIDATVFQNSVTKAGITPINKHRTSRRFSTKNKIIGASRLPWRKETAEGLHSSSDWKLVLSYRGKIKTINCIRNDVPLTKLCCVFPIYFFAPVCVCGFVRSMCETQQFQWLCSFVHSRKPTRTKWNTKSDQPRFAPFFMFHLLCANWPKLLLPRHFRPQKFHLFSHGSHGIQIRFCSTVIYSFSSTLRVISHLIKDWGRFNVHLLRSKRILVCIQCSGKFVRCNIATCREIFVCVCVHLNKTLYLSIKMIATQRDFPNLTSWFSHMIRSELETTHSLYAELAHYRFFFQNHHWSPENEHLILSTVNSLWHLNLL